MKYAKSYAPTYKEYRPKRPLNTRIGLARHKARLEAERKEEVVGPIRIPRKWSRNAAEIDKLTEGVDGARFDSA